MADNINFNELWAKQTSIEPNQENLLLQIKKMKRTSLRKLVLTNCLLVATSVFIILVWVYFQPQMITSKIGIILIILAMAIYLLVYNKSYSSLRDNNNSQTNREYLKELLSIKTKQLFMHTTMTNLYFVLLSTGLALYMYEYASRMKPLWEIVTYGITFIWILFNWVYLRPKQIKKQTTELDAIITKFEILNDQLKGEKFIL